MAIDITEEKQSAPDALYERFFDRISVNPDLSRSLVSFQANKAEPFYRWFKYKEGFSSELVRYLLRRLARRPGVLLDPFAGTGAALFAGRELGWNGIGIELLPAGINAILNRLRASRVDPKQFREEVECFEHATRETTNTNGHGFQHIPITAGAFSEATERAMAAFLTYCDGIEDQEIADLFRFACFSVLEEVSFTRKDGQYLRWDNRSPRKQLRGSFHKGRIPSFSAAILARLRRFSDDIDMKGAPSEGKANRLPSIEILRGSCLELLPSMRSASVDFVLTSPPYCNRYDYTRTYALELAFLGCSDDDVKGLRQAMLSCTVENKEKSAQMAAIYQKANARLRFERVEKAFAAAECLESILAELEVHRAAGHLNNSNVPRMIRNYFYEMCFVVCEIARILKRGGTAVIVNDNVRYSGEEIPVDLVLSDFAEAFGLHVRDIWTLTRGKGNSSQQMGSHGRQELRKCVYVWEKL